MHLTTHCITVRIDMFMVFSALLPLHAEISSEPCTPKQDKCVHVDNILNNYFSY